MPKKKSPFALGMLLYALVFLLLTGAGYWVFWQFLESYELSRPLTAVNGYLEELTPAKIRSGSEELLSTLDGNIQSPDQAFAVIEAALPEEITAAKNSKNSVSDRMEYKLRAGSQVIGAITIVPGEEGSFGFAPWQVSETSFDFSYLLNQGVSITVPSEFTVSLNGNVLDESYITASDIPYPVLEEFHGEFDMPTMVTYAAGNFLGELSFAVRDTQGDLVEITGETDMDQFLTHCSGEEEENLEALALDFLNRYICYSSSANHDAPGNYAWLNQMLIPGSELSKRLGSALDGLQYVQNLRDKIASTQINGIYKLSQDRFLCDISYVLEVLGRKGTVELEHNMKVVFLQTSYGLRVEAMTQY